MPRDDQAVADGVDPREDLLSRYEQVIEVQIQQLEKIDRKAAKTAQLTTVLASLVLTIVSVAVSVEALRLSRGTYIAFLLLAVGTIALFVSLVFAIITYLNTDVHHGPKSKFGLELPGSNMDAGTYFTILLRGYAHAIQANQLSFDLNAARFRHSLTSLLCALFFLFGGATSIIIPKNIFIDGGILITTCLISGTVAKYIIDEKYLPSEMKGEDNE